ncbi:YwbE family protein [Terrimonas sp. NA20]|uniref:YwbE family protein n=1 Tax=Terrimonas ginsenosidimutans TaxID=2908004 RepID=A0ABS9KTU1_9BACT|nr:YwbE family protein [Terrimonas ginsenosidimutans]MCG2615715.1 YwbE family protein [Terrimonas ginsenosidimutans]
MDGQYRKDIYPGQQVAIILKKDQRSGKLTYGVVQDLLTSAAFHSRGIKVRLEDGQVGRVAETDVEDPDGDD